MDPKRPGVADIFRRAGPAFRRLRDGLLDAVAARIMAAIERCRTSALGGASSTAAQSAVATTSPSIPAATGIAPPARGMPRGAGWRRRPPVSCRYRTSISSSPCRRPSPGSPSRTVASCSRSCSAPPPRPSPPSPPTPGASASASAAPPSSHTWNQRLEFHPHLHCVVPNAGFDGNTGQWRVGSSTFFAPVKVLARYFRRRFLEETERPSATEPSPATAPAPASSAPAPSSSASTRPADRVGGLRQEALRRTRHTDPISLPIHPQGRHRRQPHPRLRRRDRRVPIPKAASKAGQKPRYGSMRLPATEFIRRFLLHALPHGLHRIRHFGILANGCRKRTLEAARNALGCDTPEVPKTDPENQPPCPQCGGSLGLLLHLGHKALTASSSNGSRASNRPAPHRNPQDPRYERKHARNPPPRCPGTATPPCPRSPASAPARTQSLPAHPSRASPSAEIETDTLRNRPLPHRPCQPAQTTGHSQETLEPHFAHSPHAGEEIPQLRSTQFSCCYPPSLWSGPRAQLNSRFVRRITLRLQMVLPALRQLFCNPLFCRC